MSDILKHLETLSPEKRELVLQKLKKQQQSSQNHDKLTPVSRRQPLPLSFAQQRLWFLDQLEGDNCVYNVPFFLQLQGFLNIAALEQAIREIVQRHEVLRTTFSLVDELPIQVIHQRPQLTIQVLDWQQLTEKDQLKKAQQLALEELQQRFDLSSPPLLRVKLLQLADQSHVLLLVIHHIVCDGWSMDIFRRELFTLYTAFCAQEPSPLPELSLQYADFAQWQRQWLQGEVLQTQLNYWQKQLAAVPPLLELPTDRPRSSVQSFKGRSIFFKLNQDLTRKLKRLSQESGTTLFMTLLAAFTLLLSRYSRQEDLVIGSAIANRNRQEIEPLIGFFVNTLALRINLQGNPTFLELLKRVRQVTLDAYDHQDLPFEKLVDELGGVRSLSYHTLFQVAFGLQNEQQHILETNGLTVTRFEWENTTTLFDLSLIFRETPQGLTGEWEYASDLFEAKTIQGMAGHFEVLLEGIVDNPQQPIISLPLLTEDERQQLQTWNQTQTDYPQDKTLVDLFEAQVEKNPHNLALVFESQSLTYQQLNQKANQLAHYLLQNHQIQPDTLISICVERSTEMIIGILGILKAGGAYVPIDPNYPKQRIQFMLKDSGTSVLLTQSFLTEQLPLTELENPPKIICLDGETFTEFTDNPSPQSTPLDLAYAIYTSGSTGTPKGVLIEHRSLVNMTRAVNQVLQIQPQSRLLQFASISFDASIWEIATALAAGASLYLAKKETLLHNQDLVNFLGERKITHVTLPPTVLALLPPVTLPDWQTVVTAGEACPTELVTRWANGRRFFNAYGPTESTVCASIALCEPNGKKPPIGQPLPNVHIYILDAHNQPLPPGIPGELCIAGVGLARGYLHRPNLSAEKFLEVELFGKTERIYKTGDLARWGAEGNLEYLGRIDDQIKLRGFRIELGEIESILLQHPLVKEAVVILYETENNQSLIAYVTGITTNLCTQLKNHLKSRLPDYMIPAHIVVLDKLPLTPNGKIDRQALPAPNNEVNGSYAAPRNEVEKQLTQVWCAVLELQEIGIHDNFFDRGGHSLLAMKLLNDIQQVFGQQLSLSSLFQNPTIAQLAQQLCHTEVQSHPDLLSLQLDGDAAPLFCLPGANGHGFYFRDLAINLGTERPVYGLETPGRDGLSPLPDSVAAHASQLIDCLRQQQAKSPYILAGYSSGCAVAFEMAAQLEQQGEKVGLLAIFDAGLVSHPEYITDRADIDWIWLSIQRTEALKGVSLGLKYDDLAAQADDQARWDLAAEYLYRHNILPEYSTLDLLKTNMKAMKVLTRNYANYQPHHRISAPIVLFRAQEVHDLVLQELQAISNYDLPDWGWQVYAQKPVKVISVPGNHGGILYEPNVKILATELLNIIKLN